MASSTLTSKTDPIFFASQILGFDLPKHQKEWFLLALEQINKGEHLLLLGPADHGKSFVFAHILPLYLIAMDRRLRIILAGGAEDGPKDLGHAIASQLEANEEMIAHYGEFKLRGHWGAGKKRVIGSNLAEKDPSFFFCGTKSEVKNRRADIIICDDLVTLRNSRTEPSREKIERFFFEILMNTLEPWGVCIVNGTREHEHDLHKRLELTNQFKVVRQPAIIDEEKKITLWPERWPYERLVKKREMDYVAFMKRYENTILERDEKKEALKLLPYIKDQSRTLISSLNEKERDEFDKVYVGLDPNLSKNAAHSRTVLLTMGFKGNKRYLLNLQRRTFAPAEWQDMIDMVEREILYFRPDDFFVENNSFGQLLRENIRAQGIKVTGLWTGWAKQDLVRGVPSLYPIISAGLINCPYGDPRTRALTDTFLNEVLSWPNGAFQDCVMAWYFIEKGRRKGIRPPPPIKTSYHSSLSKFHRKQRYSWK